MNTILNEKYWIQENLFRDTKTEIFKASGTEKEKEFLVQRIPLSLFSSESFYHFKGALNRWKSFHFPSLLSILDFFEEGDSFYLVYEDFPFIPVKDVWKEWSVDQKIRFIHKMSESLQYLHEKEVIYRNLTPENILIHPEGDLNIRLMNYGLMNYLDDPDPLKEKAEFLLYAAPEQTGILKRPVDQRSDLYSLGILFYELVTGKPPFQSSDMGKLIYKHLAEKPKLPSAAAPGFPSWADAVVLKLLEKEPAQRYQSAPELRSDLEKYMEHGGGSLFQEGVFFQIPVIGRGKELNLLKQYYRLLRQGRTELVVLKGEAGVGKTALTEVFKNTLDSDIFSFYYQCSYSKRVPYAPFSELIRSYFRNEFRGEYREKILEGMGEDVSDIILLLPFLKDYLSPEAEKRDIEEKASEGTRRERVFSAFSRFLKVLSGLDKKIVFFIDDVQWMDPDNLELLHYLKQNLKDAPLLMIVSLRKGENEERIESALSRDGTQHVVELQPLEYDMIPVFVNRILNTDEIFRKEFYHKIYNDSLGNPLLALEIIKEAHRARIIEKTAGGWEVNYQKFRNFQIETGMDQLIEKRLGNLNEEELNILEIASTVGPSFKLKPFTLLVEKFLQDEGKKLSPQRIFSVIDQCRKKMLIQEQFSEGEDIYSFMQDGIYEILYQNIPAHKREKIHRYWAEILEGKKSAGSEEAVFSLAYHYGKSDDLKKKLYYFKLAYEKSLFRFSLNEAVYYQQQILDHEMKEQAFKREMISSIILFGRLTNTVGKISLGLKYLEKALHFAKEKDWNREKIELDLEIGTGYYLLNNTHLALFYYNEAMRLASEMGEEITNPAPYKLLGYVYFFRFELEKAREYLTKAIEYTSESDLENILPLYGFRSWIYDDFGQFELARRDVKRIEDNLEHIKNPLLLAQLYHLSSFYYSLSNEDPRKALEYSFYSWKYAVQANDAVFQYSSLYSRMFAYYIMGKLDKCQQVFEKAIRISKQKEVNIGIHYFWSTMALCYLFKGEFEKADEIAKRFLWGKEAIQDSKGARILFLRVHAFVLYREGKKEKALEFLEEAYELFQNTGLIFEGLPVLVFTRYILERDGKPTEKVDQEIRSHLEKEPRLQAVVEKAEKLNGMLRENGGKADNRVFTDSIFREKIQLSAIIKTSQMISSILNIEELLNVFLEKTLEITGGERGILFLSSGDGSGFEIKKSKNIDKDIFSEKLFEPVFSEVEMNQKGLIWKKENHALFEDFSKLGVKSILVTPLKRRGEVVGILYLDSQLLENLFSEEELDILDVFTSQAAIGIENATFYRRLEEKVRERTQELKNLNRISTLVSSTLDIGKVIEIVYRTFHDFFGIEGIAVQYVDYHEKQIQFMDICVPEIEEERRQKILNIVIPLSPEGGSCAHVVNNRKIVYRKNMPVFSDIQNPYDRIGMEILKHKSVLIFPLEMHGEVIGLIHFFSYSKEFDLSPKDIATIQTYASQVSTAIHNSRLYQELHDEKQNLEELNRELQSAQLQLIQSEKMASLGQLTAGIAHEINNPLSFVINNHFLISDIAGSLKGSQIPDPEKLEDLGLLVSKSRNGLGRIKNIVNNLRSFSRLDEGEDKLVDLNECIESTLGILEHLFKPPVYLDKKMGKIPMVKGSGGKLNQVFMNLIVNGIDALEGEGTITLETFEEDGSVKAVIRDNGAGIPQEIQNRIFDPFFTTKEVGKGTGLGLSISYGIIEKHGGKIRMESSEGEGTAFYLSLPVAGE